MKLDEYWPIYEATRRRYPEDEWSEFHFSLGFAMKAINGDLMWAFLEKEERLRLHRLIHTLELKQFAKAVEAWNDHSDEHAAEAMLRIASRGGWFVLDLLKDQGLEL